MEEASKGSRPKQSEGRQGRGNRGGRGRRTAPDTRAKTNTQTDAPPGDGNQKESYGAATATGNPVPQDASRERNRRNNRGFSGQTQGARTNNNKNNHPHSNHSRHSNHGKGGPKTGQGGRESSSRNSNSTGPPPYPPHLLAEECLARYAAQDPEFIRGKLRVLPAKDAASFVSCDRGFHMVDVCIASTADRNRAMDGDMVYVELLPEEEEETQKAPPKSKPLLADHIQDQLEKLEIGEDEDEAGDTIMEHACIETNATEKTKLQTWQDDPVQVMLWNPVVSINRPKARISSETSTEKKQRKGRVVHVLPPKTIHSELDTGNSSVPTRRIVGTLKVVSPKTVLLTPNNKCLDQFRCPSYIHDRIKEARQGHDETANGKFDLEKIIFEAQYVYGSWEETHKWPPCIKIGRMGSTAVLEDEIAALLAENEIDASDFSKAVLKNVDDAVKSGVYLSNGNELGWKPTPDMYEGRRDYRSHRIFTIDPTTAKDLDDALHITEMNDGTVEVGVHIADVSFFIRPGSAVDREAQERATTVYLVDRTIPMLPRPLCEVACSLNENVERLAFSCVWRMNPDGTMCTKNGAYNIWYGRTVIKSCARLDYATAQNIIDGRVAHGESESALDESLWPKSRRPTGGHTIDEVAADVRLMHKVAMARRRLRFDNGALALNSIKLTFQLDTDGQTPLLAAPYPIRDSNRLIEEYMLLANFLVAQRLITHTGRLAMLRHHEDPLEEGLDQVVSVAKAGMNFNIDISSSQTLHRSLVKLGQECEDPLVLQCVTQMLMTPMRPAKYLAAGSAERETWRHFALNIPYYTHFTSPIRRYPDVMVHRLLQASIDGEDAVNAFYVDDKMVNRIAEHCSGKGMASKKAQERCDRIFLALHVRAHPIAGQMGVVVSVGVSTFTVFVPSLGVAAMLFLEEHKNILTFASEIEDDGTKRILLQQIPGGNNENRWNTLEIKVFTRLQVSVIFREKPPIDVKVRLEGPWKD